MQRTVRNSAAWNLPIDGVQREKHLKFELPPNRPAHILRLLGCIYCYTLGILLTPCVLFLLIDLMPHCVSIIKECPVSTRAFENVPSVSSSICFQRPDSDLEALEGRCKHLCKMGTVVCEMSTRVARFHQ